MSYNSIINFDDSIKNLVDISFNKFSQLPIGDTFLTYNTDLQSAFICASGNIFRINLDLSGFVYEQTDLSGSLKAKDIIGVDSSSDITTSKLLYINNADNRIIRTAPYSDNKYKYDPSKNIDTVLI